MRWYIMFSLLKLKVSGYKMLSNDFIIDFLPKARVNYNDDDSSEIVKIDNNLYTYNVIALLAATHQENLLLLF